MFEGNKTVVGIYLSRKGCLAFTQAVFSQLKDQPLVLIIAEDNAEIFEPEYKTYKIQTAKSKVEHLLKSFTIQKKIDKLLEQLIKTYGAIELYFPAFHPWNQNFIKTARKKNVSTTLTIHDYITHKGEQSKLIENLQKKMIRLSDRVLFLTNFVRQQAIADLGLDGKFKVSPHPILNAHTTHDLNYSTQPSLLFLGRGVAYKGLDLLLAAIENLPIQKLTIAGEQDQSISSKNTKIDIIDSYLDDEEIGELLATHHILVLPYIDASQSGVLTLGISAGIPMVITKIGGLQEQLPANAAVWVEPTEASLKAGLVQLINEPETYDELKSTLKHVLKTSRSQPES